jgi:amino acid adenylation domain-containing protein/non-ribosomal peptide synthase protein (TIGR01720 family)
VRTIEFLSHLRRLDVKLWADNGRLCYDAPKGALTPALRAELVKRKAEILAFLRQASAATHPPVPPIKPVPRERELPLSFAQQRLWFLDQLEGPNATYNETVALRLTGPLDVRALTQACDEIVRRHEVLRTNFVTVDGKPAQMIAPTLTLRLPVVDLQHLSEHEQRVAIKQRFIEQAQRPFDLATGPLVRATLLKISNTKEHILLLTMHHVVCDGWAIGVFAQELTALYTAFSADQPSPLPELTIQYADFAVWQREWLSGEALENQLYYWKQQLAGAPALLELPTDRPRPPVQTFRGDALRFEIDQDLTERLESLSRQARTSLFMTLYAAFAVLLSRYSGQEDIVIGTSIANRNRQEIEPLIGFFVNTLALRTDLSGNPTFRALLDRVRQVTLDAYAHQDLPFERLVDELQPERNLSHSPLFQVTLVLQNAPLSPLQLPGLSVAPVDIENVTSAFDLTLFLGETAQGIAGRVEYNTDLFDQTTIARLVKHYQTLLEGIVAAEDGPAQRISDLPLLTGAERRQLLVEWNDEIAGGVKGDYDLEVCTQQLIEAQVQRTPEAVAVVCEERRLTYRQLDQRANQLAHHLQALGVGPDVLVGLYVERSLDMMVGILGILKAGGAYVPLDPTYPQERLAFILQDLAQALPGQTPLLLTQERLVAHLPPHTAHLIRLDSDWQTIAQHSTEPATCTARGHNVAYVAYTSGSTGKPKGVMNTHRGHVNYLLWCSAVYDATKGHGTLVHSSFAFDFTNTVLFPPLMVGGQVVLIPESDDIEALASAIRERAGFSFIKITPSHLELLNEQLPAEELAGRTHTLVVAADLLQAESIARWQVHAPETALWNEYGPTETVVGCSAHPILAAQPPGGVSIGRPIANIQFYILDTHMQPVPVGVPGELYIGGAGVARGYLNRPDLTAQVFIPNPFGHEPGTRLYKTGDLARYLPDGNVEFLGRVDFQVKLRGFRVELGEIEAALVQHPAVRKATVLLRQDQPGLKQLVAYTVCDSADDATHDALREHLKRNLPDYMVPAALVPLEALPLTPNGKVDRRALPAPDWGAMAKDYVAPRTPVETTLAAIWAEVLGLDQVGLHDNFFELGGDSIISIQVVSRANQAGLQFTVRQMFEQQTIAGLAEVVSTSPSPQFEQGIVTGTAPLTPIQRWLFEQNLAEPHHFNQSVLLSVPPDLNPGLLTQAVQHLLRHHDALRLRFNRVEDHPLAPGWQQVHAAPDGESPFAVVDLSALAPGARQAAFEKAAAELQASLDLSEGPLLRAALFTRGDDQPNRLLIAIHHLVVDGVSWRILLEDLQTAYQQLERDEEVTLPPKTASFKQWAEHIDNLIRSEQASDDLHYWLSRDWPVVAPLPVDHAAARAANTVASADTVSTVLEAKHTQALLQDVPPVYNTQINDVLLTALLRAFCRWTGEHALLVDLEGHGREELFQDVNVSRTVGWFTSIFPVLLELEPTHADLPGEALKSVKERLRAIPRQGIGYGLLRYSNQHAGPSARLQALPQAEVTFNYLGQFDHVLADTSLFRLVYEPTGPTHSPLEVRSHLLDVNCLVIDGQLHTDWSYSRNVHTPATVERLAQGFMEELQTLIAHCQTPEAGGYTPSDFPDVEFSTAQLDQVLAGIDLRNVEED